MALLKPSTSSSFCKGKVCTRAVAHQAGAYPGFRSMKPLGVFLLPPGWDASPSQGYPSIKFAGTHLYTWVERGTVRVKCLAQEHNTMSPARARTWTDRSGDMRTNHEATAPPSSFCNPPIFITCRQQKHALACITN